MKNFFQNFLKYVTRNIILFAVILTFLVGRAYVIGEWERYYELNKKGEQQTPSERIERLKRLVNEQEKKVQSLEKAVRWYHHPWADTRIELKIAKEDLKIYRATLKILNETDGIIRSRLSIFLDFLQAKVPYALKLLALVITTPIVIKILFYYILAPICQKRPPFRIVHADSPKSDYQFTSSEVSLAFELQADEEILIKTDFLQTSSQKAKKRTKWLLNHSIPFSSLLSGMFMLTRIRSLDDQPTSVTVSSQKDGLVELGVIDLPRKASLVLHPRSLAGVIKPRDEAIVISRHWRLTSLHAYLTLQLRFLAFHGPCRLIVQGQRGINIEQPNKLTARMINQNSTLGFSTTLVYSCTRCETFWSYFMGKDSLFNDHFDGDSGFFIYEEMPAGGDRDGSAKNKMEGLFDTFLKIFGL